MGKVTKYGRDFNFDDSVSEDTQNQRIQSWMQMHAPKELESGAAAAGTPAPAPTPAPAAATSSGGSSYSPTMGHIAQALMLTSPLSALTYIPGVKERLGDVNLYRTLAQGAIPFADEGIAKVRSWLPGGADYDTALAEERKGVKDYAEKHGELESMLLQGAGAAA